MTLITIAMRAIKQDDAEIEDLYALKPGALWRSFKAQGLAFWALCAYFFFEYVRPQVIFPQLDVIPWGQLTLVLTLTTVFFDGRPLPTGNVQNKLMGVFVFVVLASSLAAFDSTASWNDLKVFANWVIVYFLVVRIINSESRLFVFVALYLLWSFKMAQYGFVTMAQRGFAFTSWGLTGPGSFLTNSGEYAIQMVIFTCMAAAVALALRRHRVRLVRWAVYSMPVMGAVSVMGASSRGSQLALAVIAVWVILASKQRLKVLLAVGLAAYLLYLVLPAEQIERFRAAGNDETSHQRFEYWSMGIATIQKYPFLGVGYSNWLTYWRYQKPEGVGVLAIVEVPHNIFIQCGAELGLLGFSIFILMVVMAFAMNACSRRRAKDSDNRFAYFLSYGLDAGLCGYLVAGFFVTVFFYPFFWVHIAFIAALYNTVKYGSSKCDRVGLSAKQRMRVSGDGMQASVGRPKL